MLVLPLESALALVVIAMAVDALTGEPSWLYRSVPHPVVALGRLIARLEARLWAAADPPAAKRRAGIVLVALTVSAAAIVGGGLGALAGLRWPWLLVVGVLCSTLVAQRSLAEHVLAVAHGLAAELDQGRRAVARIVGRDPEQLDEAAVARAAIESTAENHADGVVAPLFWLVLLGPLGLCAYKAINTLDSMVGHRSERYRDFGWAAARLDDVANLPAARLTAVLLLLAAGRPGLWRAVVREAPKHRSPNAGWPEAAMALVLGLRLAGPRIYASGRVDDPWIGIGRTDPGPSEVHAAVRLVWRAWALVLGLAILGWITVFLLSRP